MQCCGTKMYVWECVGAKTRRIARLAGMTKVSTLRLRTHSKSQTKFFSVYHLCVLCRCGVNVENRGQC